jgi:hypothetical protein
MNKKIALIIIALIVIISAVSFFGYYSQKQKGQAVPSATLPASDDKEIAKAVTDEIDAAEWVLYENEQYGYALKYPAGWKIGTTFGADPATFSAPSFTPENCFESEDGICPRFSIGNIHEIEAGETIENDINLDATSRVITKKDITIGGEDASFIEYYHATYGRRDGRMGLVRQEMKVIRDGVMYRFYIEEYSADIEKIRTSADWKYGKIFDAMLASFTFISSSDREEEGVSYINNDFGFIVSLPEIWEGYQVSVQRDQGDDKHTYIYFLMPTADKNSAAFDKNTGKLVYGLADIFAITVTDLAFWNTALVSEECQKNPTPDCPDEKSVVGKDDQYVFSATYGNGTLPEDALKFKEGSSAANFLNGKFQLLN